jgi:hypothetical protein
MLPKIQTENHGCIDGIEVFKNEETAFNYTHELSKLRMFISLYYEDESNNIDGIKINKEALKYTLLKTSPRIQTKDYGVIDAFDFIGYHKAAIAYVNILSKLITLIEIYYDDYDEEDEDS